MVKLQYNHYEIKFIFICYITIWPDIKVYITQICAGPKSKIPKNHSFTTLQGHIQDAFIPAKLQFFFTTAKILQPLLEVFQTERPILPFMAEYIYDILHIILEKFIKKGTMKKTTIMAKLAKVDIMEKENLVHAKNVDIVFATKKIISNMQTKKKASDRQVFQFQNECLIFLQSFVARCPLQYLVGRHLVCLDPRYMVAKPEQAIQRMTQLLEKLKIC